MQRRVVAWVLQWVALWWLWMLLAGEWNDVEWAFAAAGATVGATIGAVADAVARERFEVPLAPLRALGAALLMVPVDFCILTAALVRGRRGRFVVREFEAGGDDARSVGLRAFTALVANFSPNAYVVEIDREQNLVLLHDLVPFRKSEEPA